MFKCRIFLRKRKLLKFCVEQNITTVEIFWTTLSTSDFNSSHRRRILTEMHSADALEQQTQKYVAMIAHVVQRVQHDDSTHVPYHRYWCMNDEMGQIRLPSFSVVIIVVTLGGVQ